MQQWHVTFFVFVFPTKPRSQARRTVNKVKAHESLQTAIQEENDVVGSITQQVKVSLPPLPPTSRSLAHVSTWFIYRSINFISSAVCFARPPYSHL